MALGPLPIVYTRTPPTVIPINKLGETEGLQCKHGFKANLAAALHPGGDPDICLCEGSGASIGYSYLRSSVYNFPFTEERQREKEIQLAFVSNH